MTQFSLANLFGLTIRESANDGSDFTNPDADYRRVFLGEDGNLYNKDSAGTVTAFGGGGGDVATDAIWDAAGDLAQGTGANAAARLAAGTAGKFLMANGSSTAVSWENRELDYVEFTSDVTVSATTSATANTVVTANAVSFNGSTVALIEFFCASAETGSGGNILANLYDGSTELGTLAQLTSPTGVVRTPFYVARRLTPSNASHTYSVRAWRTTANGIMKANNGAAGNHMPGFIRITRAV